MPRADDWRSRAFAHVLGDVSITQQTHVDSGRMVCGQIAIDDAPRVGHTTADSPSPNHAAEFVVCLRRRTQYAFSWIAPRPGADALVRGACATLGGRELDRGCLRRAGLASLSVLNYRRI